MTGVPLGGRDALWATACGLLLLAQFAPADWRPALPEDTRSAAAGGQKALVLLAERAGYETVRRETPLLATIERETPRETLLALLGPPRDLTEEERDALEGWVQDGGGLLLASREGRSIDLGSLGRIEGNGDDDAGRLDGAEPDYAAGLGMEGRRFFWPFGGTVVGMDETLIIAAATDSSDELNEDGSERVGGVRVARMTTWTGGTAVLASGSAGFANRSLAWGDNAALAFRLLELAADGRRRIVLDESLNLTGTPKVVALLLDPELRPLTLHLGLLALLWGWWRGRAFGPPLPDPDPPRRTLTDHTDAAGDLAW
ncbi:MAG: DUF4350 domain-containing protein, partial [Planctomycetota bacterium]